MPRDLASMNPRTPVMHTVPHTKIICIFPVRLARNKIRLATTGVTNIAIARASDGFFLGRPDAKKLLSIPAIDEVLLIRGGGDGCSGGILGGKVG